MTFMRRNSWRSRWRTADRHDDRAFTHLQNACGVHARLSSTSPTNQECLNMQWIDPAYCDIRLGFEVTAYVYVR
ncbi:pyrroloquinoline quinone precursor peptide PqqA [Piscinibacter sp.]